MVHCKKKKKLGYLKILSQPAKADFWVFSTYILGNFSTFCCINLKQEVEKTQKSAEAGCLKIYVCPTFFFTVYMTRLKGLVYYHSDKGTDGRNICFYQSCREGAEGTGGGSHPLIVSSNSSWVTSWKQQSSLEIQDCGSAVGTDEEEGTEREERILAILVLKKVIKSLHCSSVAPVSGAIWGLSRWFMVENNRLELPGLFWIIFE